MEGRGLVINRCVVCSLSSCCNGPVIMIMAQDGCHRFGCPIPMCLSYERAGVGHYWTVLEDIVVGLVSQNQDHTHSIQ